MSPLPNNDAVLAKLVWDSPVAIIVSTLADGHILDVNDSFLDLFGYTRDEVIGQTSVGLGLWVNPEQRAQLTTADTDGQRLRDFEASVRIKSGAERQVLAAVTAIEFDSHACLLTQLNDVTAYRQIEPRFRALVEQLPVITYVHVLDAALTMTYISPQVETMLGYSPIEVLAGQPDFLRNRIHPEDRAGVLAAVEQTRVTGEPFRAEYRVQARDDRWVWLQDEAVLVRDAQGRALLWQGILVDVTERRRVEAKEARYSMLFQHSLDAVLLSAPDGRIFDANPEACHIFGRTVEELRRVGRAGLVDPDDPRLAAAFAERARTGHFRGELTLRRRDGESFPAEVATQVFTEPDGELWTSMTIRDMTSPRQAEAALRRSEARFTTVFRASPVAIVIRSLVDGRFRDVNDRFLEMTGYAREEVVGRTPAEVGVWAGSPEDDPMHVAGLVRAHGGVRNHDGAFRTKTGELRHVLLSLERIELEGEPCLLGFGYDVTERKRMEEELRRSEERFRALVANASDIITILDGDGIVRYESFALERVLGYAPEELVGLDPFTLIHPDDVAAVRGLFEEALSKPSTSIPADFRFSHKDGSWRWLQVIGTNMLDDPAVGGVVVNSCDVTERKQAEVALWESEERFRSAFDHAATGMALIGEDDRFLQVNNSLCTILDYSKAALLDTSFAEITLADDRNVDGDLGQQLLRGEIASYQVEKRLVRKPDEVIWSRLTVSLVRGSTSEPLYFVAQIQDITPFKAAGAALRESEERFRNAFDHAPTGMALVAPDGQCMQVNRVLCELVGYSEEELLGRTVHAITHPDDLEDDLEQAARMWAGEIDTYQLEKRYIHKDRHEVWVLLTESAVRNGDVSDYAIAQMLDITGRRHLEMDRAIMLATEREYTAQLRALTEMRTDLTAMIAHELRAPVAALRMMTFLLATKELSSQDEGEMFAAVKGEIEQLDRLINDVADATSAEREDFSVQLNPFPLNVLFENAAAYARATLSDHPFTVSPALDVRVWCDPERISQVLRNLLDNAAKHTPPDTPVALSAHCEDTRVRIEVADQGPGLPAKDVASIFGKFGRGHQAAAQQTPGAGLGLYLSREITRAHGSELTVAAAPGNTVFAFDLEVSP